MEADQITSVKSHWPLTLLSSFASVFNLALPLVLARVFPAEVMGQYKLFFLYLGFMPWLCLSAGIGNGLYHWGPKPESQKSFQLSWSLLFTWSLLVSFLMLLFLRNQVMGAWFAVATFLTLVSTFHEDALIARGRTWRGAFFLSSFEIAKTILLIAVALKAPEFPLLVETYVVVLAIKVLLGIKFGWKQGIQRFVPFWGSNRQASLAILKYSVPVSFASLIAVFTHYADQLMLSHWSTPSYFAGYALGCLTIPPLNAFEQAVNRVLIPSLDERKPRLFRDAVAELTWLFLPATFGLIIFAGPIINLLFTSRYTWTIPFLRLYSFNFLLLAFPYDALARARGDGRWILKNLSVSSLVALLTLPGLTYYYHGIGALIGLLLTQLSLRVGGWIDLKRTTNWKTADFFPIREFARQLLCVLFLSVPVLFAGYLIRDPFLWFILFAPIFTVLYFSCTMKARLLRHFKNRERLGVLHLTQYLEVGGLERIIYFIAHTTLRSREIDPYVMSYDLRSIDHSLKKSFENAGIPTFCTVKESGFSFSTLFRILHLCYSQKIELIHTHDLGPLVYAVIAKIMTFGALKIIHTQHSFIHLSVKKRYRFYEQLFTRLADKIVVISKEAQETYLELGVKPNRIIFVQNGVFFPEAPFRHENEQRVAREILAPSVSKERLWVLYLARIHAKKGQNHALELWSRISPQMRAGATLIFVGQESSEGELNRLLSIAKSLGIELSVHFAGVTSEAADWLRLSDVFLSLSEYEGMPLSPIEAYGSGLPLILSSIPGHAIFSEDALLIHNPLEEQDVARFEDLLLQSTAESLKQRSRFFSDRLTWRENYGVDKMVKKYFEIYREICS